MSEKYFSKLYLETDSMIHSPWKKVEHDLPIHQNQVLARINDLKENEPLYAIVRFFPRKGWLNDASEINIFDSVEVYAWMEIPRE